MKPKTILITGASRGIGKAIAIKFAREGYYTAITGLMHREELEALREEISQYNPQCLSYVADASSYEDMRHAMEDILARWGHLDLLVNNAGIASLGLFTDLTPAEYERLISVNLLSVLHCCHLAIPSMVARKEGRIINISSVWGICGASCEAVYSAAKSGVNGFTRALAKELAPSGIAVNAIAYGVVDTDMNRAALSAEDLQELEYSIPIGRMASAAEAAEAVWQLANSPIYLTGQVIAFDGGFL